MSMSTMKKVCLAGLAIVASANAEPESVFDCANELSTVMNVPNSDQQRCEALVTYSKCLSQFDADKGAEELLFRQNSKICEPYWKKLDTPTLQVRDDHLTITVDDAKEVKFYRHRREEISVFDLNEQVVDLIAEVKALKAAAQDQQKTVTQSLADTTKALEDQLKETSEALEDALDEKSQAIDQTVAGLESKVDDSVAATDQQLADAKTATDKQLADAKTESKANMDALKKEIGESVDSKLKPSSKVIASLANSYHSNPKIPVFRVGKWHTQNSHYGWLDGNRPNAYGGVNPSTWTDSRGRADQMNNDFKYLQRLFTRKATATIFGATICSETYGQRSSTTGGVCGAIFRIKNTGKSSVSWNPKVTMTSWHGWGETASISLNGGNVASRDCYNECHFNQGLQIPANSAGNRVSTVIFISTSSHSNNHYNHWRSTVLNFGDNSLNLPNNLEYVDDLDVQTGAWKK